MEFHVLFTIHSKSIVTERAHDVSLSNGEAKPKRTKNNVNNASKQMHFQQQKVIYSNISFQFYQQNAFHFSSDKRT